ncbi:MFS transporter [Penicillium atrosanguineum]|uniref:MFS transporter n=1 Tax=Penicillium atrosanguineum TaxID=1132637 RepID=A0A9W9Q5R3_9EURO|nr:MFS transporter [Penicillium atrosanguineum]
MARSFHPSRPTSRIRHSWPSIRPLIHSQLGSLICGFAPNSNTFIVGRAVAGVGASGVASGGFVIVLTVSSEKAKPLLIGICSSCFAMGLILAPVIGGALTEKATWRWCFWVNLPPGALTLFYMLCFFNPPSIQHNQTAVQRIKSLDLIGCGIFIPAIFMLLLAMIWGGTKNDWDSATIIGLFMGSGVILILFVSAIKVMFQAVQGATPLESGTQVLAAMLSQIVGTLFAGILALYTQFSTFDTPPSHWIGFQVIHGLGVGMAQQMSSLIVQLAVKDKPDLIPVAVSLNLFFQYLGATVTQVLRGIVFRSSLGQELAYHAGLTVSQIALLSAAGTAHIRETTEQDFPKLLRLGLECYNTAITSIFFVAVATTASGFFLAFGVKWTRIDEEKRFGLEGSEFGR